MKLQQTESATVTLEDGTVIRGKLFGRRASAAGEVVFNTGMVGYPETLTDPSYRGQILVMTYPLTGNYGVPKLALDEYGLPAGFESMRIQVSGLIVSEHAIGYSHHSAVRSLSDWLDEEGVPGVFNVDTRALTKHLREKGSMLGTVSVGDEKPDFFDPNATDLGSEVCTPEPVLLKPPGHTGQKPRRVVLLDCGCKANIIRCLLARGLEVMRVPHHHYFLNLEYDGLVISNGPGDPKMYTAAAQNVGRALALNKPIFGICLGNQILARAIGTDTYKLKFGHRSQNQPCIEVQAGSGAMGRCVITSQNHGYAVRSDGLPKDWRVWFTNANDGTVEGIRHMSKPFFAVQFHPEATPGPADSTSLFDEFEQALSAS